MSRSGRRDAGETLIEILMSIAILGIASTGLIMGLSTGIFATDSHRRVSSAEAALRAYGELAKASILHPTSTVTTSPVGPFAVGEPIAVPVGSTSDFPSTFPYTIALGDALVSVTSKTTTAFNGEALASGWFAAGEDVRRYESCPAAPHFADILIEHPELTSIDRLAKPEIDSITFYDSTQTQVDCSSYRGTSGTTPCAVTDEQRTTCDPPWLRLDLSIKSTDTGRSQTSLTTAVIVRRAA